MRKIYDNLLTWRGLHNTQDAFVQVQIFGARDPKIQYVVILTEPPDNPGTSVTNGAEMIAEIVLKKHTLDFATTVFYEHYLQHPGRKSPETFDKIIFEQDFDGGNLRPKWQPVSWVEVARHIDFCEFGEKPWSEV